MALLQQLQIEQALADICDFTLHVVSYQAEGQLERCQSLPSSTLERFALSRSHESRNSRDEVPTIGIRRASEKVKFRNTTGSHEQTSKLRRDRKGELHALSEKSNYYNFSLADVEKFSLLQKLQQCISSFTA
jgi:hypothetical protein